MEARDGGGNIVRSWTEFSFGNMACCLKNVQVGCCERCCLLPTVVVGTLRSGRQCMVLRICFSDRGMEWC